MKSTGKRKNRVAAALFEPGGKESFPGSPPGGLPRRIPGPSQKSKLTTPSGVATMMVFFLSRTTKVKSE